MRSLLEAKKTLRVYVAVDNAIRQIPQLLYSFYTVMAVQQLFQTRTTASQQQWEEKWDECVVLVSYAIVKSD